MGRYLAAATILLIVGSFAGSAHAQAPLTSSNSNLVNVLYGLRICKGPYALCAASTCTPTGGTIDVNTANGPATATFPAAACTCPVFDGPAIADVNGGNMQGDCKAPGKGQVWSLYWPKSNIPQAATNWSRKPAKSAVSMQVCAASDGDGASFANCFSFACTIDKKKILGVRTATCICPMGEDLNGEAVDADSAVITPAGQCDSAVCGQHPVGAPAPGGKGSTNECLGSVSTQSRVPDAGN